MIYLLFLLSNPKKLLILLLHLLIKTVSIIIYNEIFDDNYNRIYKWLSRISFRHKSMYHFINILIFCSVFYLWKCFWQSFYIWLKLWNVNICEVVYMIKFWTIKWIYINWIKLNIQATSGFRWSLRTSNGVFSLVFISCSLSKVFLSSNRSSDFEIICCLIFFNIFWNSRIVPYVPLDLTSVLNRSN